MFVPGGWDDTMKVLTREIERSFHLPILFATCHHITDGWKALSDRFSLKYHQTVMGLRVYDDHNRRVQ